MPIVLKKLVRQKKRVGRGIANRGAKSGRGMKGQKSRAGYSSKAGFEGGQTPLYMRLPKGRGTKQKFASQVIKPVAVKVSVLNMFDDGSIVGPSVLRKAGLVKERNDKVKLVGNTPITKKVTVRVHAITENAEKSVVNAGGKVELIKNEE